MQCETVQKQTMVTLFLKLILLLSEIALYALDVYYNQTYLNQQSKYW